MTRKRIPRSGALVSGQAGIAIFRNGKDFSSRRVGEKLSHPCRVADVPYLLGEATDVLTIIGKSTEQVSRILENEFSQDQALHLVLIILDSEAHLRAKTLASLALEDLLGTATIKQFVLDRLYTRPLPAVADAVDALRRCVDISCKITWALISELRADQHSIRAIRDRWDHLGNELFGSSEERSVVERVAIDEGMFFRLCKHPADITDEVIGQWADDERLERVSARDILSLWAEPFRSPKKIMAVATQMDLFARTSGGA